MYKSSAFIYSPLLPTVHAHISQAPSVGFGLPCMAGLMIQHLMAALPAYQAPSLREWPVHGSLPSCLSQHLKGTPLSPRLTELWASFWGLPYPPPFLIGGNNEGALGWGHSFRLSTDGLPCGVGPVRPDWTCDTRKNCPFTATSLQEKPTSG